LIPVDLVRELATAHAEGMHPIVAPLINGQRSNPVLFDRQLFQDLSQLSGDVGGRVLFSRYPIRWVEWIEEGIDLDIDTEQDYSRLVSLGKKPGD
jgi:molybdenum cofactor cytidylyltransferase